MMEGVDSRGWCVLCVLGVIWYFVDSLQATDYFLFDEGCEAMVCLGYVVLLDGFFFGVFFRCRLG